MTKLGLVGAGHIHTPGFVKKMAESKDVAVKLVWDHDAARAANHAKTLRASVATTPAEVFADGEISAVVICSETNRHRDLVLAAAEAGKHMFVEKPLGIGAADGYEMAAAIEKAGVTFQTGYAQRGSPVNVFLKEQIEKGAFGKITRMRHSTCHSGSLGGWFDTEWRWMADPAVAGCGAFGDLGTHSLDILLWFLGRPTDVTASLNVVTGRYGECDETGEGLLKFEGGAVATLAAAWVDVANPVPVLISGTEGHAHVAGGKLFFKSAKVAGADGEKPWTDLPAARGAGFDLFLEAMRGARGLALVTAREAAQRSAVMEAMYLAHAARSWVAPDWR